MQHSNPLVVILILLSLRLPEPIHSGKWTYLYAFTEWLGTLPELRPLANPYTDKAEGVPRFLHSTLLGDVAFLSRTTATEVYYTYLQLVSRGLIDDHK